MFSLCMEETSIKFAICPLHFTPFISNYFYLKQKSRPLEFVMAVCSLSHYELIKALVQETNRKHLRMSF